MTTKDNTVHVGFGNWRSSVKFVLGNKDITVFMGVIDVTKSSFFYRNKLAFTLKANHETYTSEFCGPFIGDKAYYLDPGFKGNVFTEENWIKCAQDVLSCVLLDAIAYREHIDLIDFCNEFGYTESGKLREGVSAYYGCKDSENKLKILFTEDEINTLNTWRENYDNGEYDYADSENESPLQLK